jgi:conjugative relaxase-like TrwC/TraI family protein
LAWMRVMGIESVAYHRQTVLDRGDDHPGAALGYYASRGEMPLAWGGGGAARLGLDGQVTPEQYSAVFGPGGARDPSTGARLVMTKRPGLELVVSAHKSVAELGVIGRAEDMHRILDAERDGTLAYLDTLTRTRGGRRGRTAIPTPTLGLVYAHTRHATSRAGDPCPHDHVLVANVVEMLDETGGWKAADTRLWREHLHAATAYGRLCSARVAIELGYGIVADDGPSGRLGHWAIAAIPDEAMAVHSKRAADIDREVGPPTVEDSYRARAVAARTTRQAKRHEPVEDLMVRWRRELTEIGLDLEGLNASVTQACSWRITADLAEHDLDRLARALLGPDGKLAAEKVFARRDVIVAAAPYLFGLDPAVLDRLVDRVLAHPDAVALDAVAGAREPVWSPADVLATEQAIESRAFARHATGAASVVPDRLVGIAIETKEHALGGPLTASQRETVRGICRSGRDLDLVVGVAGAGKTTALEAIRHAYERDGHRVLGTATSGQAARTIGSEAGIESSTLASLLWRINRASTQLDERTVVILDEAAMTDDQNLLRLICATGVAGAKLILVGDDRQLGAVGPGGSLRALVERFGGTVWALADNVRQRDLTERDALAELRAGDIGLAIDWLAENSRIVCGADHAETVGAVVDGWLADLDAGLDTIMLAWRRANVETLNQLARDGYEARGWLDGPELIAPGGRRYRAGDHIVTLAALPGVAVTSETGTIEHVFTDDKSLGVHMADGRRVLLPRHATIRDHLDHGYALTVHRAQGTTVDTAHRLEDGGGRELAYVALSRAREHSTVYVEADTIDQAIEDLNGAWAIEHRQTWALDAGVPAPDARRAGAVDLDLGL